MEAAILYYPPGDMRSRRAALILLGTAGYCAIVLALFMVVDEQIQLLPEPVVVVLAIIAGPPVLFAAGTEAWPLVAFVVALVVICSGLARRAWRKSAENEWFVFWLLCALFVWAGSPWLLWVFVI